MNAEPHATIDVEGSGGQFDGRMWHLRDGGIGVAWSIRGEPSPLVHLVTNFLYDADFAGSYLQLLWGARPDGSRSIDAAPRIGLLLKSFRPTPDTSWSTAARRLVSMHPRPGLSPCGRRHASRTGIADQADDLQQVATFAGLRPVRLTDPAWLERVRCEALATDLAAAGPRVPPTDRAEASPRPAPDGAAPATRAVASLRRYRVEAIEDLTGLLTDRAAAHCLRALTFVQSHRDDHAAHGWLYPLVGAPPDAFAELEGAWSSAGYRLVLERTLELPARLFLAPFGPSPALESSLEPCAVRVILGERPTSPAADVRMEFPTLDRSRRPPTPLEPSVELPWAA